MSDMNIEISFRVTTPEGRQLAKISAEYADNNWADVVAVEELVIPDIVEKFIAAGKMYAQQQGLDLVSLKPAE